MSDGDSLLRPHRRPARLVVRASTTRTSVMVVCSDPCGRRQVQLPNGRSNDFLLLEDALIGKKRESMGLGVVYDSPSRSLLILHVGRDGSGSLKPLPHCVMIASMDFEVAVILGLTQSGNVDHASAAKQPEDADSWFDQCQYGQDCDGVTPNISFQSTSVPVSDERLKAWRNADT